MKNDNNIYSDSQRMNYGDGFSDDDSPELVFQSQSINSRRVVVSRNVPRNVNGVNNANSVNPAPPGAGRYPIKKRKSPAKTFFKIFIVIITVIILAFAGFMFLVLGRINYTNESPDHSISENAGISLKEKSGVTNILLFGEDNHKEGEYGRADSIILLTIDNNNKQLKQTSFMRDLYLSIPGHDDNKLNAAYSIGGPSLACETVEYNFGIKIDNYMIVDFNSFTDIVDSLGGIDLELTYNEMAYINWQSYRNKQTDDDNEIKKDDYHYYEDKDGYSVAMVHLNGRQALWYARDRDSAGSDFDRTQRQRIVINTIFNKLKSSNPFTLAGTVYSVSQYLSTNMTPLSLTGKGFEMLPALSFDKKEYRIPTGDNYYDDYYDYSGQVLVISDTDLEKNRLYDFVFEKAE